jgi:hypothetical protein
MLFVLPDIPVQVLRSSKRLDRRRQVVTSPGEIESKKSGKSGSGTA